MTNVAILGSTGSIGRNTLDVVRRNPRRFRISALAAGSNLKLLAEQVREFRPALVAVLRPEDAGRLAIIQGRAFLTEIGFAPPEDQKRLRELQDPPLGPPDIMDVKQTVEWIQSPECVYYKILLGDYIAGGVFVAADAEKYHMENFWRIFVEPMYQDRGIGEEAMRQIFRLHPVVKRLRLGTPEFHTKNRHFYERMGFTYLELGQAEEARRYFERAVSLPIYPTMTDADTADVLAAVRKIVSYFKR